MKKILYLLLVATMTNIQVIMAQEKITETTATHRQQLSGSHIQGADTVQQCHFRAGMPQQLAHSPCD